MTTTDAVATRLLGITFQKVMRAAGVAGCAFIVGVGLAGCGATNILGDSPVMTSAPAELPVQAQPQVSRSKVALAPIMGAPDGVSKDVGSQLGSALERQRVAVAKSGENTDYTLRGYMVATKEKAGTKVSYIFDLTDPTGKRVNRIQGEEVASGGDPRNPWAAVTPDLAQRITDKTATTLAASLASLSPTTTSAAAPVGVGASAVATPPPPPASDPSAATPTAAGPTTGSIDRGAGSSAGLGALVPDVTGAPGDGNLALANAMRDELRLTGIGSASPGQRAYSVVGKVAMGPIKDGKQSIKIDWRVTDPGGTVLATVSQNNEIQAGVLDGAWGAVATDAAQGAAAKIKALIDESRAAGASAGTPRSKAASRSKT